MIGSRFGGFVCECLLLKRKQWDLFFNFVFCLINFTLLHSSLTFFLTFKNSVVVNSFVVQHLTKKRKNTNGKLKRLDSRPIL